MEMTPTLVRAPQAAQTRRQPADQFSSSGRLETDELPEFFPAFWLDHTQLPDEDGIFAENFQEHLQAVTPQNSVESRGDAPETSRRPAVLPLQASLLNNSILPVLKQIHPNEQFAIGQDCGIYWRAPESTESLLKYVIASDWFYVPNVPPLLKGKIRRSYVMWQELISPALVFEFASGDGREERDQTPDTGKFWIYERWIRPFYYAIYEVAKAQVEVYHWEDGRFIKMATNQRGHYPLAAFGVELGIWQGKYEHVELPWLRWWDAEGNLLLTGDERAERETQRAERLAAQLRAMGVEPEV